MASAAVATSLPTTPGSGPATSPAGVSTSTAGASGGVGSASFNINATTGSDFVPARATISSGIDTTTSYEQSRRQVSSVVISEQLLGDAPGSGGVKYVEVPVIEEVVRHVPGKREVVETEKIVPKYEYEWIEKTVEVPQIRYIDRPVEVEKIQEVIRTVPIRSVQEVPREVIKTVPKVEYRRVEKTVEVPGEVIERTSRVVVENPVHVKRYIDRNEPVVVAQTICPIVTESAEVIDVDVYEYEPQVIPIDVHVAKPIPSHLTAIGATSEIHQHVTVPAAQYNTILRQLNVHLANETDALPYIRPDGTAHVPFLTPTETPTAVAPNPNAMIHPQGTVDVSRPFATTGITTGARSVGQIATTSTATRGFIQPTASSVASAQYQPSMQIQARGMGSNVDLYQTDLQQRSMSQQINAATAGAAMQRGSMAVPSYPQAGQRPAATSNLTVTGTGGLPQKAGKLDSASLYSGQHPSRPSQIPPITASASATKAARRYTGQGTNSYLPTGATIGTDNNNNIMVNAHKRRPCEC